MEIEIRRNRDIRIECESIPGQDLESIFGELPELTKEQKKMFEENQRRIAELERAIMEDLEAQHVRDLLGDLITKETHEIGYDEIFDEQGYGYVDKFYCRPKKSEYEK